MRARAHTHAHVPVFLSHTNLFLQLPPVSSEPAGCFLLKTKQSKRLNTKVLNRFEQTTLTKNE